MSLNTKSLLYNFLCFAGIYILVYFLARTFTNLTGIWIPVTAAVVASLLSPKFQTVKTANGQKMFMKWLFIKEVKEIQ